VLINEVIKILGVICPPFNLVLQPVCGRRRFAANSAQATGNWHQGKGSFRFSQQAVINVLRMVVVIVAHPRVPLSSLDRSTDFASLGRDNNCLDGVPRLH
jgi:hypothetical protein